MKTKKIDFKTLIVIGIILLITLSVLSIAYGAADIDVSTVKDSILKFDSKNTQHQIIKSLRFPRVLASVIVGSCLAVSGAIMQGTTRNYLTDSGLLGISSGATFAMALSYAFLKDVTYGWLIVFSLIGSAFATSLTFIISIFGKKTINPQRLVLAGMSISMLFSATSTFVAIKYNVGKMLSYWSAGGTASAKWEELIIIIPIFIIVTMIAIVVAPTVTIMSLGNDIATNLGVKTTIVGIVATIIVFILTAIAVVLAGPISFVGLIIPHMIRYLIGVDYKYIVPLSALYGGIFLLLADLLGRLINKPNETPLGIIFAIIGVPLFLYLARKQKKGLE